MKKNIGWNNVVRLAWLGVLGALLAGFANLIPYSTVSWGILAVGVVITLFSSLTGLYFLKKNRV
ncbi:hypothetical protein [Bacillus sp. BP-3]|uniref:hypothetical protein n=1 Tax=Bacillus sp. BP-3 TaxID=3022773 RepID=UPI00232DB77F|nr:hypothetical protein [Bacillus sp. BP-3]MDC2865562.1 hypothetical protein [Bacillus sp. BP-3]